MRKPLVTLALTCALGVSTILTASARAEAEPAKKARQVDEPSEQPPAANGTTDRVERAKELYEEAAAAYAARRHFEAIELFRQSAALEPSPLLSYNMALAYEEAGDLRNALKHFREYAAEASDQDDADEVKARILRLESKLGKLGIQQLTVQSTPVGATVLVDGTPVGVTPYTAEYTPGTHTLRVSKPGYLDAEASVELAEDRAQNVALTLLEAPKAEPKPTVVRASPPATPREDTSTLARIEPLSWSLLGVGVGALTAGVVFEVSRANSAEDARKAEDPVEAAEAQGAADSKRVTSVLLLGAGGAFTITGAILAILDVSRGGNDGRANAAGHSVMGQRATASVSVAPGFQGVSLSGRF